jgi:hypothetical protein
MSKLIRVKGLFLLCPAAIAAAIWAATCTPGSDDVPAIGWGKPVGGAALSISTPKTTYFAGERIILDIELKNFSHRDVKTVFRSALDAYSVNVLLPDGKESPQTLFAREHVGVGIGSRFGTTIHPGQSVFLRLHVSRLYDFSLPGTYTLSVTKPGGVAVGATWGGDIVSNTIKVEVADPHRAPGDDTDQWISASARGRERNKTQKDRAAPGCLPRVYVPKIDAYAAGRKAVEMFDTNRDGVISGNELDKCPGLKAACMPGTFAPATLDPARTGRISAEMITKRIKNWQANGLGPMSLRCTVKHNHRPLEGADVKFAPEPFLAPYLKTANGVTDQNGVAMLTIETGPEGGPPGVPPGFYRVEITKPARPYRPAKPGRAAENGRRAEPPEPAQPATQGLDIPAKYNTQTILGEEVAVDVERVRNGISFDLIF